MTAGAFRIRDLLWIIAAGPYCWPLALQILRPGASSITITSGPAGPGISVRFRQARTAAGLTRQELAVRAGVSPDTVAGLEAGYIWKIPEFDALSRALNVDPLWLACTGLPDPGPAAPALRYLRRPLDRADRGFALGICVVCTALEIMLIPVLGVVFPVVMICAGLLMIWIIARKARRDRLIPDRKRRATMRLWPSPADRARTAAAADTAQRAYQLLNENRDILVRLLAGGVCRYPSALAVMHCPDCRAGDLPVWSLDIADVAAVTGQLCREHAAEVELALRYAEIGHALRTMP